MLTNTVPAIRSGWWIIRAMYPGTTIPPAATAKVSEKIRLITKPMPTACIIISRAASVCNLFSSTCERS